MFVWIKPYCFFRRPFFFPFSTEVLIDQKPKVRPFSFSFVFIHWLSLCLDLLFVPWCILGDAFRSWDSCLGVCSLLIYLSFSLESYISHWDHTSSKNSYNSSTTPLAPSNSKPWDSTAGNPSNTYMASARLSTFALSSLSCLKCLHIEVHFSRVVTKLDRVFLFF